MTNVDEIGESELLYRKVSVNSGWYDPERGELKPDAFRPRADDDTGISFDRAKCDLHPDFRTIEEAAQGPSSKGYYVAIFRVADLRAEGFSVVADPDGDNKNPGHALITDLTYGNRNDTASQNRMVILAHKLKVQIEGPFA